MSEKRLQKVQFRVENVDFQLFSIECRKKVPCNHNECTRKFFRWNYPPLRINQSLQSNPSPKFAELFLNNGAVIIDQIRNIHQHKNQGIHTQDFLKRKNFSIYIHIDEGANL